jgi:hypothetical protein
MKNTTLTLISTALLFFSTCAFAEGELKADATAINSACASDAVTASCGTEKVGSGLLKCLRNYKKTNPSYKFSEPCKSSMLKMRADRKSKK